MFFKNISIYRFVEPFALTDKELAAKLYARLFKPCGLHEASSFGFVAPVIGSTVHEVMGNMMICGMTEEKLLPASVVNELLDDSIAEKESAQDRKLSKKERLALKEEIIFNLLPKAFTHSRLTYAYINKDYIIIDAAPKKAEELLSQLRKAIGTLPVVPLNVLHSPIQVMTDWLSHPLNNNLFTVESDCEMRSDDNGIIKVKNENLSSSQITRHIDMGHQVHKLALSYDDKITFTLDTNLSLSKVKFIDVELTENETDQFDTDFTLMTGTIAELLPVLIDAFGGLSE